MFTLCFVVGQNGLLWFKWDSRNAVVHFLILYQDSFWTSIFVVGALLCKTMSYCDPAVSWQTVLAELLFTSGTMSWRCWYIEPSRIKDLVLCCDSNTKTLKQATAVYLLWWYENNPPIHFISMFYVRMCRVIGWCDDYAEFMEDTSVSIKPGHFSLFGHLAVYNRKSSVHISGNRYVTLIWWTNERCFSVAKYQDRRIYV